MALVYFSTFFKDFGILVLFFHSVLKISPPFLVDLVTVGTWTRWRPSSTSSPTARCCAQSPLRCLQALFLGHVLSDQTMTYYDDIYIYMHRNYVYYV